MSQYKFTLSDILKKPAALGKFSAIGAKETVFVNLFLPLHTNPLLHAVYSKKERICSLRECEQKQINIESKIKLFSLEKKKWQKYTKCIQSPWLN